MLAATWKGKNGEKSVRDFHLFIIRVAHLAEESLYTPLETIYSNTKERHDKEEESNTILVLWTNSAH